jgi:hypothetical protein
MMTNTTSCTAVSFSTGFDNTGRTLETCYATVNGDRYEFTSFNGGKIEAYRFDDGIPMFVGYRADAWIERIFAAARAERARLASIAERPLELA